MEAHNMYSVSKDSFQRRSESSSVSASVARIELPPFIGQSGSFRTENEAIGQGDGCMVETTIDKMLH